MDSTNTGTSFLASPPSDPFPLEKAKPGQMIQILSHHGRAMQDVELAAEMGVSIEDVRLSAEILECEGSATVVIDGEVWFVELT